MNPNPVTAASLVEALERLPIVRMIGGTPLLALRLFEEEVPRAELFAKAEWINPGGSVKDPRRRMPHLQGVPGT